jgi:hypothetical protein
MLWTAPLCVIGSAIVVTLKQQQFKEAKPLLANELRELARTDRRNADKVVPGGRGNPYGLLHSKVRANDWDPIRAKHYGQRPSCRTNRPHT